jgi:glutaredoxin
MEERIITIGVIILVLLAAGMIIYFRNFQSSTIINLPAEEAAKWIGEHATLYSQSSCSHCIEQKKLFGSNVKYLTIVEDNIQAFLDAGVTQTPTWIINGQKYEKVLTIDELKELTGYTD